MTDVWGDDEETLGEMAERFGRRAVVAVAEAENARLRAQLEAVSQKALDAIAPCVVGWDEMPEWAEALAAVVPDLQDALGIPHSAALSDEGGDDG
jgi:hypothetical protein